MKKYISIFFVSAFSLSLFIFATHTISVRAYEGDTPAPTQNNYADCSSISGYKLTQGQSCNAGLNIPVVFNFKAKDPENDNLSWAIDWGDGRGSAPMMCPSYNPNTSFSTSHSWTTLGSYTVRLSVSDCKGGTAVALFKVVVKKPTITDTFDNSVSNNSSSNSNTPNKNITYLNDNTILPVPPTNPTGGLASSLQAPTNVNGVAVSQVSNLIKWDQVNGADGYNIYKNGTLFARARYQATTSFYDNGLSCATIQKYFIEAYKYDASSNVVGSGNLSSVISVQTADCGAPQTYVKVLSPTGGTYKVGDTVHVTWKATGVTSNANSVVVAVNNVTDAPGTPQEFGVTWYNDMSGAMVLDTGSYDWDIPLSFAPGSYYVWVASPTSMYDRSVPFTITN